MKELQAALVNPSNSLAAFFPSIYFLGERG
jgi:hypothetical protein